MARAQQVFPVVSKASVWVNDEEIHLTVFQVKWNMNWLLKCLYYLCLPSRAIVGGKLIFLGKFIFWWIFCLTDRSRYKNWIQVSNCLWHLCKRKGKITGSDKVHGKWHWEEDLCVEHQEIPNHLSWGFSSILWRRTVKTSLSAWAGVGAGQKPVMLRVPAAPHFFCKPLCPLLT